MSIPLRVLIADDSEDDVALLLRLLRQSGWDPIFTRVDSAETMNAALDAGNWELVISDFSMPQFGGFDALAIVRKRNPDIPFILVSGIVGEETAVEAVKAGANDYLFKGNMGRLARIVERELRDAIQRREGRSTQENLRNRDAQLADAQQLAHVGAWHIDVLAKSVIWSDETFRIVGRPRVGALVTLSEFLDCLYPEDRALLAEPIQSGNATHLAFDCRISRPDGQTRRVYICGKIVRDENGRALHASGMIQDITERKLAEEEIERHRLDLEKLVAERTGELEFANQLLKAEMSERKRVESHMIFAEKMASLGQLVAGIAHEINNPLSFVISNNATLRRDMTALIGPDLTDLKERQETIQNMQEAIDSSRDGLDRIKRIVSGLRDFARLDEEGLGDIDLNAGIKSTVDMLRHKALDENIQLELDLQPLPSVCCYPAKMNQVVMNLVGNAIDASPTGGKITIRSAPDGEGIRVDVIDHGQGIDPSIREKIFDPFFTTKPPGKGTGLGLSISYGIIHDHGGRIDVESTLGAATRFTLWIPCQHDSPTPALKAAG
jgi:signal transduction histidine kinase